MARTAAGTTTATVTWLGHATVLLELGGVRLLTDPVLRSRVAHLRRHAPAPATPRDVDAVLLSHAHHDHLDLASLRRLGPVRSVMVPRGTARALRRVRARGVTELVPGDERAVGEVSVRAVRADHDGRRARRGPDVQALGYVVEHAGMRIYFAGDTDRFAGMGGGAALDLALLPVWGWGPSLGSGHMGPRDAARAAADLQPGIAVPIHWGTFLPIGLGRRHGHLLSDPAREFAAETARLAAGVEVRVLAPGDVMTLRAPA